MSLDILVVVCYAIHMGTQKEAGRMAETAKYPGTCRRCGQPINVGDEINWEQGKGAEHVRCPAPSAPEESADVISIRGGEGYGYNGWREGQTIYNRWRAHNGGPDYLTVVSAGDQYYAEDGMSFGVGDESGCVYWAKCRPATEAEIAPLTAAAEAAKARRIARERLAAISDEIRQDGECPAGEHRPDGKRLADTQTLYGGGDWFMVGDEWIWYVRNNGGDGDNWSANNVRTGGAGAIGWRVPFDADLAAKIRA